MLYPSERATPMDLLAFTAWFDAKRRLLLWIARNKFGLTNEEAEEATQEWFLHMYTRPLKLVAIDPQRPHGYLVKSFCNFLKDRARKRHLITEPLPEGLSTRERSPLDIVHAKEVLPSIQRIVKEALAALPLQQRIAYSLKQVLDDRQAALRVLGISVADNNRAMREYDRPLNRAQQEFPNAFTPHRDLLDSVPRAQVADVLQTECKRVLDEQGLNRRGELK
jgi:DNA-directed RNA polymerase specialized sigma24 family protein